MRKINALLVITLIFGLPLLAQAMTCPMDAKTAKSENWQAGTTLYQIPDDETFRDSTYLTEKYGFVFTGAYWEENALHCQYYSPKIKQLYLSIKQPDVVEPSSDKGMGPWHKPSLAYQLVFCVNEPASSCTFKLKAK